jgi:hypothetical protein
MPELNYVDRSFHKDNTAHYHLSIQADRNGLVFCIQDNRQGVFIVFRRYRFDHVYITSDLVGHMISVFDRDEILKLPFHSVHFMGYSQQSTLVPAIYCSTRNLADYIDFNMGGSSDGELFSNLIRPLETHNIFLLPRALVSLVTLHFKRVEFSNQATPFLLNVSVDKRFRKNPVIHVGLNSDFFDIAVMEGDKLLLYNTFQFVNETDLLYYILFVCKQLSLKTADIPLVLSGELSSRLTYFETVKRYLPATSYDTASVNPPLASGLMPVVTYKYLNLFNLQACELSAESIKAG